MAKAVEKFAPGWKVTDCGPEMDPGLRAEWAGRKNVLVTHPLDRQTGCVLSRKIEVTAGKKTTLHIVVGHDPQGDFDLIVRADGRQLARKPVNPQTATDHWLALDVDLSSFAGKQVILEHDPVASQSCQRPPRARCVVGGTSGFSGAMTRRA